MEEIRAVRL